MVPLTRIRPLSNRGHSPQKQLLSSLTLVLCAASFICVQSSPLPYTSINNTPVSTTTIPSAPAATTPAVSLHIETESKFYAFEILNPAPNDVWISGTVETLSWVDSDLPEDATFDITLIPAYEDNFDDSSSATKADTKMTNPRRTRRPLLRHVSTMNRFLDLVVPYDLISIEQLRREQLRGKGTEEIGQDTLLKVGEEGGGGDKDRTTPPVLARLIMTAYEARTSKILAQRDVFPIEVRKDYQRDWRAVVPLQAESLDLMEEENDEEDGEQSDHGAEDTLLESGQDMGADNHEAPSDNSLLDEVVGTEQSQEEPPLHHDPPTEHDTQATVVQRHKSSHDDHSPHLIDPNHFQNEDDIELWKEHESDPGYNPPIQILDAGTLKITQWIENKERFYLGAPYVLAWDFPSSDALPTGADDASMPPLTGTVSVYVEDAFTAERYDIVAANLPSNVQFLYLHPTRNMMSTSPLFRDRVFVRARIELDLFWEGKILRYTGLTKVFFVERGAL